MQERRPNSVSIWIRRDQSRNPEFRLGRHRMEHKLYVRHGQSRIRFDEGVKSAWNYGRGTRTEEIRAQHANCHPVKSHLPMKSSRCPSRIGNPNAEMVLKGFADWQVN